VRAFALQERYVIFGMNGESGGHAVALFEGRDGVRFYDPNLGEAFFENREKFQGFLSEFVSYYSKAGLGSMKNIEITDFACSLMPKSPEDAELTEHGYLPLNLSFPEYMLESGTREEMTSDTD
jgi:Yersinia/Haemophilus virulence surface antigen